MLYRAEEAHMVTFCASKGYEVKLQHSQEAPLNCPIDPPVLKVAAK